MSEQPTTDPRSLPADVKRKLLAARDALTEGDAMEAYHQIYSIAAPHFDKLADEVWTGLESPEPVREMVPACCYNGPCDYKSPPVLDNPSIGPFSPEPGADVARQIRNIIGDHDNGIDMEATMRDLRELADSLSPTKEAKPGDDDPYQGPDPILLGIGKIRVAICSSTDDPLHVARELVIYDDGDGPKPVGTPEPEHAGKRADQVGKVLARLRVMNAKGAMVFADDLMTVIENAARADDGFPETKVEKDNGA